MKTRKLLSAAHKRLFSRLVFLALLGLEHLQDPIAWSAVEDCDPLFKAYQSNCCANAPHPTGNASAYQDDKAKNRAETEEARKQSGRRTTIGGHALYDQYF